jgi:hypothetical protein
VEKKGRIDPDGEWNYDVKHNGTFSTLYINGAPARLRENITIPPRTSQVVLIGLHHDDPFRLDSNKKYLFESKLQVPGVHLASSVLHGDRSKPMFTNITNTTLKPLHLKTHMIIGRISAIKGPIIDPEMEEDEILDIDDASMYLPKKAKDYEFTPPLSTEESDKIFVESLKSALANTVLTATEIKQLSALLYKYKDRFEPNPSNPGTTDAVEHNIDTGDAKPIKSPPSRGNPETQEIIKKSINDMLKAGIIEPSRSPWASRIVIVRKKDGTPRFCVDYRDLNNVTVKDSYPLPYQTDIMDSISEAKYFSSLDLASGYWQIKLDEDAKLKSAFVSRVGLFQFTVMPFGLTNAPATFQRLMDLVLAGLTWIECMVYLDDIIILKNLETTFRPFRTCILTTS